MIKEITLCNKQFLLTTDGELYQKCGDKYIRKYPSVRKGKDSKHHRYTLYDTETKHIVTIRLDHLVYEVFVGNLSPLDVLKHKDGDTRNCSLDNLEVYKTPLEIKNKEVLTYVR